MRSPARPDGRSYARALYEFLVAEIDADRLGPGDVLTLAQIETVAGGGSVYQAVAKASKWLRASHKRDLVNVRGVGYQLVVGMAQVDAARKDQKRAARGLDKAATRVRTTDMARLSAEQRRQVDALANNVARLAMWAKRADARIDEVAEKTDRTDTRVSDLERRLSRLEELDRRLSES